MSSNSVDVCNHTRDKQIRLPLHGRPILLLVWLQTELDSAQSYYHYLWYGIQKLSKKAKASSTEVITLRSIVRAQARNRPVGITGE